MGNLKKIGVPQWGKQYSILEVEDRGSMTVTDSHTIYVDRMNQRIDFKCPCGCGDWITLNTIPNTKPTWKLVLNTISPSIQRVVGCQCHFFITNGRVSNNQAQNKVKG